MQAPIISLVFHDKFISVNSAYMTRGRFRVLTEEARNFKTRIAQQVKDIINKDQLNQLKKADTLAVCIEIESPTWICKNGHLRKKDIASAEKCLTDAIFSELGVDDSKIFQLQMNKKLGNIETITYSIFPLTSSVLLQD